MTKLVGLSLFLHDKEFLKYIHAVKIATYRQIQRDCYPSHCLDAVGNRMRKLARNNLVCIQVARLEKSVNCLVSISDKGFKSFIADDQVLRAELTSDAYHHDLTLVNIRSVFCKLPSTVGYYTENQIQTWENEVKDLNSDALVISQLKSDRLSLPIEYESTLKSEARYEGIIKRYYDALEYPLVLFLTEDKTIIRKISDIEKKLFNWDQPKFFYQTINSFSSEDKVSFSNYNKSILSLGYR